MKLFDDVQSEEEARLANRELYLLKSARFTVLNKWPNAYVHWLGVLKYEIRRKRTEQDLPALVPYVIMSDLFSREELAWKDAAEKLTL